MWATYNEFYLFNLIPFLLIISLVAFYRMDWIFIFTIFTVPLSIPLYEVSDRFGFNLSLPTELLLIGMTLLFITKLIYDKQIDKNILYHPVSLAIYFYLFWMLITSVTSTMPVVSFKKLLSKIWFLTVFYYIASQVFRDPQRMNKYFWAYILPMMIVIFYSIIRHLGYGLFDKNASHFVMKPFFPDHTSYGAILAMFIPVLVFHLFRREPHFVLKLFIGITIFIYMVAFILSYTRAAWISLIIAVGIYIIILLKIKFRYILLVAVLLTIGFFSVRVELMHRLEDNKQDSSEDLMEHVKSISNITTDASNLERINRWKSAFRMFAEKPVFGWGPGTYMFQYAPFQRSYDRTVISTNFGNLGNAHSEYIGPLADSGVLGSVSFILIMIISLVTGFRVYRNARTHAQKNLAIALTLGLITYYVHGLLNNFLDTDKASAPFWGFMAALVVLDIYFRKNEIEETARN
jgi:O-antigen ligase